MKRIRQEEGNRPKRKITRIIRLGGVVFIVVLVLEIWMANRLSTYGSKIEETKGAQSKLELENQILENEVARKSSLLSLEPKAASIGFNAVKNPQYYHPVSLASAQ